MSATRLLVLGVVRIFQPVHGYFVRRELLSWRAESWAAITDDHTPFLRAGVPAVDLIDWSYPGHACCDALSNLSVRSLDAVGETLLAHLREAR